MAQKLFGFGSRPNTPVSQAKPAEQNWYEPPENSPTHCLHTQPKPHVFARMASYLNLRGPSQTPLAPMWDVEKSKHFNVENFIQESDRIWHNPSLLQMVETVGCCLMKNGLAETIPKELNSYVACMVEQYRWMHHQTKQCKAAFKDLEQLRETERKEFKDMSDEWKQREQKFKSEIKRLELQIMESNPGNGMEKVLLNRQSSVVNRNDTKRFSARLDKLSGTDNEAAKNEAKNENQKLNPANVALTTTTNAYRTLGNVPRLMDHNNDVYLSDKLRQQQFTGRYQPPLGRVRIDNPRYFNTEALQRAAARATPPQSRRQSPLRQVTTAVQESQPRKKSGSSSSSTSSSARSSVSLITAGLAEEAARRGISPPSGVDSIEKHRLDANIAMKALKEQLKTKAMPECAIEDDDDDMPDGQQKPEHHRARSFDSGDDKNFSTSKIPMITVQEYKEAVLGQGMEPDS